MAKITCPKCGGKGTLPDQREIGAAKKLRRIAKGLTLSEAAERMGISEPYLSDLEHGNRTWTDALCTKFSEAINDPRS